MIYKVIITPKANFEINQSIDWYNEQKAGLGKRFYSKLKTTVKYIRKNPLLFEKKYKIFRCATVDVFPFIVVYFIDNNYTIVISAVFHTSRNSESAFDND